MMFERSRLLRVVATAAAAALALTACSAGPEESGGEQGRTLTIGSQFDNNSWDSAALEIGNRTQFWQPVYDTLLTLSPAGDLEPGVAESWSYNDDNTTLTLELRDDVTFSDDTPLDAEAVKASIEHLRAGTGQNSFMAASIEEIIVVSDTELELHLSAPNPALLSYLAWVGGVIASPTAIADGSLETAPVGSGPYVLDAAASTVGSSYVYTRRDGHWDEASFPYDRIVVLVLSDPTARLNAAKSGQIDAGLITPAMARDAEASGLTLNTLAYNWSGLLIADRAGDLVPALGDVRVRQAINMALDRESLITATVDGFGEPTTQVFNLSSQSFVPALEDEYAYDPDAARALLAEAGYPDGFTLTMPSFPGAEATAAIYSQQLADIGITVELELLTADSAIAELLSGKYPMFIINLGSASAWQDIQTWITPTAPWNMRQSTDPELNALLAEAQAAVADDQDLAFQNIGTWLVDNAWFAPALRPLNIFVTNDGTSVEMQAQNSVPSLRNFSPAD